MARRHAILGEENFRIPEDAFALGGFQRWIKSGEFPETGRIDYLEGNVEVDMSPEDVFTHGVPKTAIASKLNLLVADQDRGYVLTDSTRLGSRFADLSVEPDVLLVLEESLERGTVRWSPASSGKGPRRYAGVEGAADLVVEIVSDSSVKKDTRRLPPLYAQAGVLELWIVDARSEELRFEIHTLREGHYGKVPADGDGWTRSPRLGHSFRLTRRQPPGRDTWSFKLEHRDA